MVPGPQALLLVSAIAGTLVSAQQASAPSPGGSLASAPAPGTPGDYTVVSGLYTYTLTPTISVGAFALKSQAYFSGNNGSLASAGSTTILGTSSGIINAQISNPPSPMNTTIPAQRYILTDLFGGAACVSYSFASNASSVTVGIADADQYLDMNYSKNPVRFPYTLCGASNCTSSNTYALNASAGHYFFNVSNPSSSIANVVLSYTLYPANASACQGLNTASRVPTPYTQTTPAIVIPPLQTPAIIYYDFLADDGALALVGSVRNTSCTTALLNVNSTYQNGRLPLPAPVYLLLLDQHGVEDLLNPRISGLIPVGGCQAGLNATSCAFTASGLVPGQAYHLWLTYTGNASAFGLSSDAFVTTTFATSTFPGSCSNLISTNATNGGFNGYITFTNGSSDAPATAPSASPVSLSSPSPQPSSPGMGPSPSSSSSAAAPAFISSGSSASNVPVSLGNGIFVNSDGYIDGALTSSGKVLLGGRTEGSERKTQTLLKHMLSGACLKHSKTSKKIFPPQSIFWCSLFTYCFITTISRQRGRHLIFELGRVNNFSFMPMLRRPRLQPMSNICQRHALPVHPHKAGLSHIPQRDYRFHAWIMRLSNHAMSMGIVVSEPVLQTDDPAVKMAGTALAPFAQQLVDLSRQLDRMDHTSSMILQLMSAKESFMSLRAVAVTQLTQQMHGLQQVHLASYNQSAVRQACAVSGPLSQLVSSLQQKPMDQAAMPVRKQARKKEKAVRMALKQQAETDQRLAFSSTATQPQALLAAMVAAAPSASEPTLVYPGRSAELQWNCITEYAHLPDLLTEWEDGIQYACGGKKTPPFKTLEQDMAEGHQPVAWRNIDRKPLRAKKLFIYTLLSAEQPRGFVVALQAEAEILGPKQKDTLQGDGALGNGTFWPWSQLRTWLRRRLAAEKYRLLSSGQC
ncbi:hypothetical protein WJX74_004144 [Apatococcus lobatus]|uniref:Uncharacterized protein n=1 Tax=Apatococcus lobatus TaxID=904363 RepID=A0AAW1RG89_9CHLO